MPKHASPPALTDEMLVAYVDGELDPGAARTVEAALAEDAGLTATARALRDSAALLRPVHGEPRHEPPPRRFLAALERGRRRALPRFARLVAASVAALVLGAGGGFFASEVRLEQMLQQAENARLIDELAMRRALVEALETSISGTPVAWHSVDTGRSGEVVPVRTFRSANGVFCREYEETMVRDAGVERVFGIACRQDTGVWIVADRFRDPGVDSRERTTTFTRN